MLVRTAELAPLAVLRKLKGGRHPTRWPGSPDKEEPHVPRLIQWCLVFGVWCFVVDVSLSQTPNNNREDKEGKLPDNRRMEMLAKDDPIAFLENCLIRYDREVQGYRLLMQKQERLQGKLQKREVVEVCFEHGPAANGHSVFMRWIEGARLAARVLYVEGLNNNKMIVKPAGFGSFLTVERDPEGPDARRSGRYTVKQFGLRFGVQSTLDSYRAAQKEEALHVAYHGRQHVQEAGGRECFVLERTGYKKPEEDGITRQLLFVDTRTWLLVGTILKNDKGQLLGEYFFRDIRLNPKFDKDQFTRQAVDAK
jgi:hypothetical protein